MATDQDQLSEVLAIEARLVVDGVRARYGVDLSAYSPRFLERTMATLQRRAGKGGMLPHLATILRDERAFRRILDRMLVGTSEFFREPEFFSFMVREIFPVLSTYPTLKLWVAGCSRGQELISLAVLLEEQGLLERTTIFATDINDLALEEARRGVFHDRSTKQFVTGYMAVSGRRSPSDYYVCDYRRSKFRADLLRNVMFMRHDVLTQPPFDEFHLILCRNVLIYGTLAAQERALNTLTASLVRRGFLGLGRAESAHSAGERSLLCTLEPELRWYQRER